MSYRLSGKESLRNGIRRVISEQIERALAELAEERLERSHVIHQVRKRCKKIRGALRLVRDGTADYAAENARYRDAARRLSELRDADVMIGTYDLLADHFAEEIDGRTIQPIRRELVARRRALLASTEAVEARLDEVRSALLEGRRDVAAMAIGPGDRDVLLAGLRRTYGRGRKASDAAAQAPDPATFHEWRKRVKYHGYHLRLLRLAWPAVLRTRHDEVKKLGHVLGEHHDLCVLRTVLLEDPPSFAHEEAVVTFLNLLQRRLARLEERAAQLGCLLFAEKPGHLARRFGVYVCAGLLPT